MTTKPERMNMKRATHSSMNGMRFGWMKPRYATKAQKMTGPKNEDAVDAEDGDVVEDDVADVIRRVFRVAKTPA